MASSTMASSTEGSTYVDQVYKDYLERYNALRKALTIGRDDFMKLCDPELKEGVVEPPASDELSQLPQPAKGIKRRRPMMDQWLHLVDIKNDLANHNSAWLKELALYHARASGFLETDEKELLDKMNKLGLPTLYETEGEDLAKFKINIRDLEKEENRRPLPDYMQRTQKDVTATSRGELVAFLVDLGYVLDIASDTLYLTISLTDRYLSKKSIIHNELQLLGVSSMLIASKCAEVAPKSVEIICWVKDTYTKKQILDMEADVRKTLNNKMGYPTVKTFLRRFKGVAKKKAMYPKLLKCLADYLAELSLHDYECVKFLPSTVAAAAIFLANITLQPDKHPWDSSLQSCTGYKPSDLKECALLIHELQLGERGESWTITVKGKYDAGEHRYVSRVLLAPGEIPASYFEEAKDS